MEIRTQKPFEKPDGGSYIGTVIDVVAKEVADTDFVTLTSTSIEVVPTTFISTYTTTDEETQIVTATKTVSEDHTIVQTVTNTVIQTAIVDSQSTELVQCVLECKNTYWFGWHTTTVVEEQSEINIHGSFGSSGYGSGYGSLGSGYGGGGYKRKL